MTRQFSRLLLMILLPCALLVAAEHGGSGGEEAGLHNEMLWKTLNFIILVGVIGWGLKKVGGKFFNSRTDTIQQGIVEARKMREEAEEGVAAIERRMENLGAEIENLRASAKQEIAAEEARLKSETERLLARTQANAEQEIASAAKHARNDLRAYSAELALKLARQEIRQRTTPEVADRLVNSFVGDLGRVPRRIR